jgi:hypothetical protein
VLQGRGGAAVAGLDPLQVAADLPGSQDDTPLGEGVAQLAAGPGAILGERPSQFLGHTVAVSDIGCWSGLKRVEGREAACKEGAEQVADSLAAVSEVLGDPRGRPSCAGEEDHLGSVADLRRQRLPPQGLEFITGCVVKLGANHTEL